MAAPVVPAELGSAVKGTRAKPAVFIISSSEAVATARHIAKILGSVAIATVWDEDVFPLTRSTLEGLVTALGAFDFAVALCTPDDLVTRRGDTRPAAAANVIFELGLFMGKLGRERCFIISEKTVETNSDLYGISVAPIQGSGEPVSDANVLKEACRQIRRAIRALGPLTRPSASLPTYLRPFKTAPFLAVMSRFGDLHRGESDGGAARMRRFEPSGLVGLGDAMALSEVRTFFESIGIREFPVQYADGIRGDDLSRHLLLIGGPKANSVTRQALQRLPSAFQIVHDGVPETSIRDSQTGDVYSPSPRNGEITEDLAVIICSVSPFARNRRTIILYGIFGYGTWSAARYLSDSIRYVC